MPFVEHSIWSNELFSCKQMCRCHDLENTFWIKLPRIFKKTVVTIFLSFEYWQPFVLVIQSVMKKQVMKPAVSSEARKYFFSIKNLEIIVFINQNGKTSHFFKLNVVRLNNHGDGIISQHWDKGGIWA